MTKIVKNLKVILKKSQIVVVAKSLVEKLLNQIVDKNSNAQIQTSWTESSQLDFKRLKLATLPSIYLEHSGLSMRAKAWKFPQRLRD